MNCPKKRLLQINVVGNSGSTGKIVESIGKEAIKRGWDSYIAYGRWSNKSESKLIKIGSKVDILAHALKARLLDADGLGSKRATKRLIKVIDDLKPDVIQIHNLHGYYINYPILFNYLRDSNIKVYWTLHDCWAFTGHCAHFEKVSCRKWVSGCNKCELYRDYPESLFLDNSHNNYRLKKELFNSLEGITIITVSDWLNNLVKQSFLKKQNIKRIYSGVDINVFQDRGRYSDLWPGKKVLMGVANIWTKAKGFDDYLSLSKMLPNDYIIVLIGKMNESLSKGLPSNIIHINRTENQRELADYYSRADVSLNLSYLESFGLTTIEAAACGTPGVVYNATASPELIIPSTGFIVPSGDVKRLWESVCTIISKGKPSYGTECRKRVVEEFNEETQIPKYIDLYEGN